MIRELEPNELAWRCPEGWLPTDGPASIEPAPSIVAQDRAVEAIAFGLGIQGIGFNVFVTGMSGTGRLTTIKSFVERLAAADGKPEDICFVFNFRSPGEPCGLILRAGAGSRLRDGMDGLIEELSENLPAILGDREFRSRLERAVEPLQRKERELVQTFEKEVVDAKFSLVQVQAGLVTRPEILPLVGDKPVPLEKLGELVEQGVLTAAQQEELTETHGRLTERFRDVFQEVAEIRRMVQNRVEDVRRKLLQPAFDAAVARIRKEVDDDRVEPYLEVVAADLGEHLELFMVDEEDVPPEVDRYLRWRVNLVVDNAGVSGRPVILETEPTYTNLFGTIERTMTQSGEATTSFLRIRAGSLLRANGGFLVLNADDVLLEPRVWPGLKRALRYRRVQIQTLESLVFGASLLKPEAVPIDVKVVIIGSRDIYDLLFRYDPDFPKIFKVLADFDNLLAVSPEHAHDLIAVLRKVILEEGLLELDAGGAAAMLEEAVRIGGWRRKFSSRFSDLADLLREASYRASQAGAPLISREHVSEAHAAHLRRHSLSEDRSHEIISERVVHIATEGAVVGQVNGLAVYDLGHHRFGKPSRITARVRMGVGKVVDIEREVELGGPIHSKGVLILSGYLASHFALDCPVSLWASLVFEQSYGGVEGDSASSAELYALLSALAELPVRQSLAVTGSVNQFGEVQAVGGINVKIEGFFDLCSARGLDGTHGVLIPRANIVHLMLRPDIVEAAEAGRFSVYAVSSADEGIALLTGCEAGLRGLDGAFPPDSVNGRVEARLRAFAAARQAYARAIDGEARP